MLGPDAVATIYTLDNLGRATLTDTESNAFYNATTGQIETPQGTNDYLRAETVTKYDALGRVYESDVYNVAQADSLSPVPGTTGHYLPTYTWYDLAGNVIKTETGTTGAFTKYAYNGLGQLVEQYTGYNTSVPPETSGSWAEADAVGSSDTILEQTKHGTTPPANRSPRPPTSASPIAALPAHSTRQIAMPRPLPRGTTESVRTVATANYGHEKPTDATHYFFDADSALIANADGIPTVAESARPETYAGDSASMAGIDFQLSLTVYDPDTGLPTETIDNLGRINETIYDAAGRVVRTIQN